MQFLSLLFKQVSVSAAEPFWKRPTAGQDQSRGKIIPEKMAFFRNKETFLSEGLFTFVFSAA